MPFSVYESPRRKTPRWEFKPQMQIPLFDNMVAHFKVRHGMHMLRLARESFQSCPEIFRDDYMAREGAYVMAPELYAEQSAQPYRVRRLLITHLQ